MDETTVAVIGGGPAGVAAAMWLHQFGVRVLLLEAEAALGGLQRRSPYVNEWIAGVRGRTGLEVAAAFHHHILAIGCPVGLNCAVGTIAAHDASFTLRLRDGAELRSRSLVLATGTVPRADGFTETDRVGIGPGFSMERITMTGKRVAILGGGDNAFDQALLALQRGAREVRIFSRRAPRAQRLVQARLPRECVQVGPFAADQSRMAVDGEPFDVIGVQFGYTPVVVPGLDLERPGGHVAVDRLGRTSVAQVYACGDVTDYWHPCVTTACAHGIQVAKAIAATLP